MPKKKKMTAPRKKRAAPRRKHVSIAPGQELNIHVLGARGKEVGCAVVEASAEGTVTVQPPPAPEPAAEPVPEAPPTA